MSLRRLGHKRHLPRSLRLLALGEAGCHFVRRSPAGEKLRPPASSHVRAPAISEGIPQLQPKDMISALLELTGEGQLRSQVSIFVNLTCDDDEGGEGHGAVRDCHWAASGWGIPSSWKPGHFLRKSVSE